MNLPIIIGSFTNFPAASNFVGKSLRKLPSTTGCQLDSALVRKLLTSLIRKTHGKVLDGRGAAACPTPWITAKSVCSGMPCIHKNTFGLVLHLITRISKLSIQFLHMELLLTQQHQQLHPKPLDTEATWHVE
jgi:hypothetical protein